MGQGWLPEATTRTRTAGSASWPIRSATRVQCKRAEAAGSMGHKANSDAALPALITQCSLGREDSSASFSKSEEEGLKFGMEGWQLLAAGSMQAEKRLGADGSRELLDFSNVLQKMSNSLKKVAETNAKLQLEAASWKAKYERLLEEQAGSGSNASAGTSSSVQAGSNSPEKSAAQQFRGSGHQTIFYIPQQKSRSETSSQKVPFKLSWGVGGDASRRHKHDIVSYDSGNISSVTSSNRQITLMWKSSPRTVCIFTRPNSEPVHKLCQQMIRWLNAERQISIFVEPRVKAQLLNESTEFAFVQTWEHEEEVLYLHEKVDLVITLGGDGTVLWTTSLFKGPVPPMVSFSMGSLGFLASFQSEHFEDCLDYALRGPLYITLRHRLQCEVVRKDPSSDEAPEVYLVLNEVAIDRAMSSSLTNLDCYCDNEFVTSVQGDGLILSTTSGSTAYSLAAGGSMVHPHVPGILFTPICPHSLSFRPLILPGNVTVKVQVPDDSTSHVWASFDGKDRLQLSAGDALLCHIACWPVPTASRDETTHHFLCSVRERLHWNLRKKQGT